MSNKKEVPEIDFQLSQIEQVGFGMSLPEGYKPAGDFQFRISLESIIDPEKKKLIVTNRIDIRESTESQLLAHLIVRYYFDIAGFEQIRKNKKGRHVVPSSLQLAVNTVALSSTRGVLFAQFKGTPLHGAILPLIDASNFSTNEVE